jgi:hypothetical protein
MNSHLPALAAMSADLQCCAPLCRLFDHLPGVQFWIKDRQGRYVTMNRACLLDYRFTDVAGPWEARFGPVPGAHREPVHAG